MADGVAQGKEISFCITCKNRFSQVARTLQRNLLDNYAERKFTEFVLVDFASTDGLEKWIIKKFTQFIEEGYLKYLFTEELTKWHMSIAKNTAHLHASGSVVVNLDCDNYTGKRGAQFIRNCFSQYKNEIVLHQFSGRWRDGSCGRISLRRDVFLAIGGYDEAFEPMGHQDMDLLLRLQSYGLRYVSQPNKEYNRAIKNGKEESTRLCHSDLSWEEMRIKNEKLSAKNLASEQIVANKGVFGIRKNIFIHDGTGFKSLGS